MVYAYKEFHCNTEQDVVLALNDFLVNEAGWTQREVTDDTTSRRRYIWTSSGTQSWRDQGGDPIYIAADGQYDALALFGTRTWDVPETYTFLLYHNSDTHVGLSSDNQDVFLYGNEDFVSGIIRDHSNTQKPVCFYMGLIKSYYDIERDDFPMLIKGNKYNYWSWTYYQCAYMHNCTTSGQQWHETSYWWNMIGQDNGDIDFDSVIMLPVVMVNRNSSNQEMRGEPYGVYHINGKRMPMFGAIATASGVYITAKQDNNNAYCYAFGPVASGIEDLKLYDKHRPAYLDGVYYSRGSE